MGRKIIFLTYSLKPRLLTLERSEKLSLKGISDIENQAEVERMNSSHPQPNFTSGEVLFAGLPEKLSSFDFGYQRSGRDLPLIPLKAVRVVGVPIIVQPVCQQKR